MAESHIKRKEDTSILKALTKWQPESKIGEVPKLRFGDENTNILL